LAYTSQPQNNPQSTPLCAYWAKPLIANHQASKHAEKQEIKQTIKQKKKAGNQKGKQTS